MKQIGPGPETESPSNERLRLHTPELLSVVCGSDAGIGDSAVLSRIRQCEICPPDDTASVIHFTPVLTHFNTLFNPLG